MTQAAPTSYTHPMLASALPDIAAHVQDNAVVAAAKAGDLTLAHLERLVCSECHCQPSEVAAFATLAARFPDHPAAPLFLDVTAIIARSRSILLDCARSLEIPTDALAARTVLSGAAAFRGFVCWLGLNARPAVAAAALRADLLLWCASCAELSAALQHNEVSVPEPVHAYLATYGQTPGELVDAATDVVNEDGGRRPAQEELQQTVRQVDTALRAFWQSVALG